LLRLPAEAFAALLPAYEQLNAEVNGAGGDRGYQLVSANSFWMEHGCAVDPGYAAAIRSAFGGDCLATGFTDPAPAVRQINEWIARRTQGAMQDVLRSVGVLPPLLLNAVYFKGAWVNQFDRALTRDRDFRVSAQSTVRVPMMHRQAFFGHHEDADVQILR